MAFYTLNLHYPVFLAYICYTNWKVQTVRSKEIWWFKFCKVKMHQNLVFLENFYASLTMHTHKNCINLVFEIIHIKYNTEGKKKKKSINVGANKNDSI